MPTKEDSLIAEDLGLLTHDPYKAVIYGMPWGDSDLIESPGPRKWQREVLDYIGEHFQNPVTRYHPCQVAISSGHDIGKSALISMVTWWAMSTFRDCRVNITANTASQLTTKTSPELAVWFRRAINTNWFDKSITSIKSVEVEEKHNETWRADLVPWNEANPAAAAGLHNKGKRLVFIIDEASEVPQIIFDTAEGVMLDENTEIIWLVCGNPTRNKGPFYDVVFGKKRHRWKTFVIDSREVEGTNKKKLDEWAMDYGEDSDFFRVRARGLPPRAESAQFIDQDTIDAAQKRNVSVLNDEPLVAGVDFAWGGADDNVIRFRCGYDARSVKSIRIKGEFTRDPAVMTGKLADVLNGKYVVAGVERKLSMLFLDSAGIAAPVEARLRQLGYTNIVTVNFGAHSVDSRCAYMRDYMWQEMKEWLRDGAIDDDHGLAEDLAGPCLVSDKQNRVKLEDKDLMKKRGLDSPDDADALALTFAQKVAPLTPKVTYVRRPASAWS